MRHSDQIQSSIDRLMANHSMRSELGDMLFGAAAPQTRFTEIPNSTWNQTVCFTAISVCLSEISELLFESVL